MNAADVGHQSSSRVCDHVETKSFVEPQSAISNLIDRMTEKQQLLCHLENKIESRRLYRQGLMYDIDNFNNQKVELNTEIFELTSHINALENLTKELNEEISIEKRNKCDVSLTLESVKQTNEKLLDEIKNKIMSTDAKKTKKGNIQTQLLQFADSIQ